MLLIPCPWCGKRPENEFRYGGQAHLARPADPAMVDDGDWGASLYCAKQSQRPATPSDGGTCTGAAVSSIACGTP